MEEEADFAVARPDRVYHYTDAAGLFGIVDKQHLWATHVAHLNDATEGRQSPEALLAGLSDVFPRHPKLVDELARLFSERLEGPRAQGYVLSASRQPDLLNQWQHYGNAGFAIGLERKVDLVVKREAEATARSWLDVDYVDLDSPDDTDRAAVQRAAMVEQAEQWREKSGGDPSILGWDRLRRDAHALMRRTTYTVKHEAFDAEKESRIYVEVDKPEAAKVRARGRALVRYVELTQPTGGVPIREIVCGPGLPAEQVRAVATIKQLIATFHLEDIDVTRSRIPYVAGP